MPHSAAYAALIVCVDVHPHRVLHQMTWHGCGAVIVVFVRRGTTKRGACHRRAGPCCHVGGLSWWRGQWRVVTWQASVDVVGVVNIVGGRPGKGGGLQRKGDRRARSSWVRARHLAVVTWQRAWCSGSGGMANVRLPCEEAVGRGWVSVASEDEGCRGHT
ncbi:hypothetical protein BJ912DRAFT_922353 [Pholiota molesta]|nr:hypothetical protein BJ912DRAFT_922353 [Pholiota molesta]